MGPDDLIKAAPAIAKGAGALAAAVPFTAIVRRMLGPAADEVAEMWRDQVRVYRYGRQLKLQSSEDSLVLWAWLRVQLLPCCGGQWWSRGGSCSLASQAPSP
jgi:hypothetical protein